MAKSVQLLKNMVGDVIIARIGALKPDDFSLVKLHAVEANGIWIECQDFTERMMSRFKLTSSKTTLVLFIPYQGIDYVVGSIDSLCLSEGGLGLTDA